MNEVTFGDFAKVMSRRKRTVDDLVDLFRGKLDDSRNFFERVMSGQWRNPETGRYEDRSNVVIPYRSVIEFYVQEEHYLDVSSRDKQQLTERRKRPVSEERREELRKQMAATNARRKSETVEN